LNEDDEDIEDQSEEKEFEDAFNEIGNDDDDYPRKKSKQNFKRGNQIKKPFSKGNKNSKFKGKPKKR
jgi:hypothetical protein